MSWWHQSHAGAASGVHRQPQLLQQQLLGLSLVHQRRQVGRLQAEGVEEDGVGRVGEGAGAAASAALERQQQQQRSRGQQVPHPLPALLRSSHAQVLTQQRLVWLSRVVQRPLEGVCSSRRWWWSWMLGRVAPAMSP
jgi:hypothetical protein